MKHNNRTTGFTPIELLVVIAVLGILTTGILAVINTNSQIEKAEIVKAKQFSSQLENALVVGQIGKWGFESIDSGTTSDASGYGNDGYLSTPSPEWKSADECSLRLGGCLDFNGVDNYVGLPIFPEQENKPFSFSAWIYWTGGNKSGIWGHFGLGNDATKTDSGKSHFEIWTSWEPCLRLRLGDRENSPLLVYNDKRRMPFPPINEWAHVAFSYDGDQTTTVYMQGKVLDSFVGKTGKIFGPVAGGEHAIGDSHRKDNISSRPFKGLIDEVQIYNLALTFSQIQHLYAQGVIRRAIAYR